MSLKYNLLLLGCLTLVAFAQEYNDDEPQNDVIEDASEDDDYDDDIPIPSLQEVVHVVTGKKFDRLSRSAAATARDVLELLNAETQVDNEYMTGVVLEVTKKPTVEALQEIVVDEYEIVDLANDIIRHFQKHPSGGWDGELDPADALGAAEELEGAGDYAEEGDSVPRDEL